MGYRLTNTAATTAAVANRIVTTTNMKNGDYTIVNGGVPVWAGAALITVTHTQVGGVTDALGTITITGTDLAGQTRTEVITPLTGTVATGTVPFRTVTLVTGAGWTRDAGAGSEDTIVVGVAAGNIVASSYGQLGGVLVNNAVAATVTISHAGGTIMVIPSSQAAGTYYNLGGVNFAGYLKIATTSTNDVTVFHTDTMPSSYSL
jgi:hypothetical protein